MVKRAMNRAPGPTDFWWKDHQATCGGRYIKVREPDGFSEKKAKQISKKGNFIKIFISRKWVMCLYKSHTHADVLQNSISLTCTGPDKC